MMRRRSSLVSKTAVVASSAADGEKDPGLTGLISNEWVDIFAFFEYPVAWKRVVNSGL